MYPPAFDYQAPDTLEGALDTLADHAGQARVLAGGQSLIPLLKLRFADPGLLIDLGRIPGLDDLDAEDGQVRIGAMTTHAALERSDALADRLPAMAAAAPLISDPLVRNRGTIGGSLAHADPAGDWGAVLMAVRGEVVARGPDGRRAIPARELITGPYTTTLQPDEILTEIRVPTDGAATGGTYLKLERKVGDFATVGVAVHLQLDDGRIGRAGIGLTAVAPTNVAATEAEQVLEGESPDEELFRQAARAAAAAAEPRSDERGSADYKRAVVEEYVARGLERALALASQD